ncbi:hypothetical protein [Leucothrix mucor]|uniref:hypothetical protein n=1 Tax=Leucothrix mucor TaxID=45248 RepID=UPI0012F7DD16|nr:hypothetical protein [Leucothrix mucor]
MSKKRKAKSVSRESHSPFMKFKLNQEIKAVEQHLSGDELAAFRKLPQAEKRDVVLAVAKKQVDEAIDAEIINYFRQLNVGDVPTATDGDVVSAQS